MRIAIALALTLAGAGLARAQTPPATGTEATAAQPERATPEGATTLAPHRPATKPAESTTCRTSFDSKLFDHDRHVKHLEPGHTQKVGGCGVCHDPKGKERGCWMRLHPGFTCHDCHKRIPGVEKAVIPPKAPAAKPAEPAAR